MNYDYEKLTDKIIRKVIDINQTWDGHGVIVNVPLLSCTKLTYQPICVTARGVVIKYPPPKINLFKKGYLVYNFITKYIQDGQAYTRESYKMMLKETDLVIKRLIQHGLYGKVCIGTKIRDFRTQKGDKNSYEWTADGTVIITRVNLPGGGTNIMEFLDDC